jgi:endoglucanase
MTDTDLTLLHNMGVLSVRLVISPTHFYQVNDPATLNPAMIGYLDKAVDRLLAADLGVVIDMHDQDKDAWHFNTKYVDGFMTYWQALAQRYANRDPDRVMFEMLNEPVFPNEAEKWAKIQQRWVAAMRQVVPGHTLIVTGNDWGGISGLLRLPPLADKNLVYSFHFYDPFQFTHQGATWAGPGLEELSGVPYPATPERCKDLLEKITDAGKKQSMKNYCLGYITASKLKNKMAEAADWGKANNVPLWLGEFGVYCPKAPAADRAKWIEDVRKAAESLKIGWSLWGYDECFGLQRKLRTDGTVAIDTDVAQALGLNVR